MSKVENTNLTAEDVVKGTEDSSVLKFEEGYFTISSVEMLWMNETIEELQEENEWYKKALQEIEKEAHDMEKIRALTKRALIGR